MDVNVVACSLNEVDTCEQCTHTNANTHFPFQKKHRTRFVTSTQQDMLLTTATNKCARSVLPGNRKPNVVRSTVGAW